MPQAIDASDRCVPTVLDKQEANAEADEWRDARTSDQSACRASARNS
jgi:hypothetical protein